VVKIQTLRKVEKITRATTFGVLGLLPFVRFPKLALRALPLLGRVVKFIAAKPFKRGLVPLAVTAFVTGSPTARETLFRSPITTFKTVKGLGEKFEEKIVGEEPESPIGKALKVGGTAGLTAAALLLLTKELKRRKEDKDPAPPTPFIPTTPVADTALVPAPAGSLPAGALPAAIVAPGAVVEKPKKARASRRRAAVQQPFFINQIQISN